MRNVARISMVAVAAVVLLAGGAFWALARGESVPAGADRIADANGSETLGSLWGIEADVEGLELDDIELETVTSLRTDEHGRLVLLAEGLLGGFSSFLVRASASGDVMAVTPTMADGAEAFGVSADRRYVRGSADGDASRFVVVPPAWTPPEDGLYFDGPPPNVRGEPLRQDQVVIGAVEPVDGDTVLVGSRLGPIIDRASADGTSARLLGPHGDPDARVTTDRARGAIVSLVQVDDGRVVFVAESADGYRLHVLDGGSVQPLGSDAGETNPVAAPDARSYPMHHPDEPLPAWAIRWDRKAMTPLAPGPDGSVITVGAGEDRVPEISLVDVDTGDVERLARLDGVEATLEEPVSATVVGDDLVFTAEGSLWRLPDARGE